ncbi:MAG: hypothetical protein LBT86_00105 [Deltaproteobacteria bacterium]|nr:hypothetical protein [Deltaproteobacteria bacterium]
MRKILFPVLFLPAIALLAVIGSTQAEASAVRGANGQDALVNLADTLSLGQATLNDASLAQTIADRGRNDHDRDNDRRRGNDRFDNDRDRDRRLNGPDDRDRRGPQPPSKKQIVKKGPGPDRDDRRGPDRDDRRGPDRDDRDDRRGPDRDDRRGPDRNDHRR